MDYKMKNSWHVSNFRGFYMKKTDRENICEYKNKGFPRITFDFLFDNKEKKKEIWIPLFILLSFIKNKV